MSTRKIGFLIVFALVLGTALMALGGTSFAEEALRISSVKGSRGMPL